MADITKTQGTSVLALQSIATGVVVTSAAIDLGNKLAATVFIHFGRRAAAALTAGARLRLEASSKSAGDGHWYPIWEAITQIAAAADEAVNGVCASGQPEVPMAATAGFAAGDILFIDNGTIADSEWGRVWLVHLNVHVTIEDNLVNAQTGATVYNKGEMWAVSFDAAAIQRIRLVVDTATGPTGQNVAVEAHVVTADSIG